MIKTEIVETNETQKRKVERKDSKVPHLFPEQPAEITHHHDTDEEESSD